MIIIKSDLKKEAHRLKITVTYVNNYEDTNEKSKYEEKEVYYDFKSKEYISYTGKVIKKSTLASIVGSIDTMYKGLKESNNIESNFHYKFLMVIQKLERRRRPVRIISNVASLLEELSNYSILEQYINLNLPINLDGYNLWRNSDIENIGIIKKDRIKFYQNLYLGDDKAKYWSSSEFSFLTGRQKSTTGMLEPMDIIVLNNDYIFNSCIYCIKKSYIENSIQGVKKFINKILDLESGWYTRNEIATNEGLIRRCKFYKLISVYKFDYKRLLDFLIVDTYLQDGYPEIIENCNDNANQLKDLYDYIYMSAEIKNLKYVEKYPKYLKSKHDIVVKNYNTFKKEHSSELFALSQQYLFDLFNSNKINDKKYTIIVPMTPNEVLDEAIQQNHCVASYIDRIINKETNIIFIRQNDNIEKSVLTCEIVFNKFKQIKGFMNCEPDVEQQQFIHKVCNKYKLSWR